MGCSVSKKSRKGAGINSKKILDVDPSDTGPVHAEKYKSLSPRGGSNKMARASSLRITKSTRHRADNTLPRRRESLHSLKTQSSEPRKSEARRRDRALPAVTSAPRPPMRQKSEPAAAPAENAQIAAPSSPKPQAAPSAYLWTTDRKTPSPATNKDDLKACGSRTSPPRRAIQTPRHFPAEPVICTPRTKRAAEHDIVLAPLKARVTVFDESDNSDQKRLLEEEIRRRLQQKNRMRRFASEPEDDTLYELPLRMPTIDLLKSS